RWFPTRHGILDPAFRTDNQSALDEYSGGQMGSFELKIWNAEYCQVRQATPPAKKAMMDRKDEDEDEGEESSEYECSEDEDEEGSLEYACSEDEDEGEASPEEESSNEESSKDENSKEEGSEDESSEDASPEDASSDDESSEDESSEGESSDDEDENWHVDLPGLPKLIYEGAAKGASYRTW
ncbi:hypothetical protein HWV62_45717, partial [Athelia sp. TMB]